MHRNGVALLVPRSGLRRVLRRRVRVQPVPDPVQRVIQGPQLLQRRSGWFWTLSAMLSRIWRDRLWIDSLSRCDESSHYIRFCARAFGCSTKCSTEPHLVKLVQHLVRCTKKMCVHQSCGTPKKKTMLFIVSAVFQCARTKLSTKRIGARKVVLPILCAETEQSEHVLIHDAPRVCSVQRNLRMQPCAKVGAP